MLNSHRDSRLAARATIVSLITIVATACVSKPPMAKVAAADSSNQTAMPTQMGGRMAGGMAGAGAMGAGRMGAGRMGGMMGGMMAPCPLALTTLDLSKAQQATFDSVRADHRLAMQREMFAAIARARAVLNETQRATFDSVSAAHIAQMTKMMAAGGGCMG